MNKKPTTPKRENEARISLIQAEMKAAQLAPAFSKIAPIERAAVQLVDVLEDFERRLHQLEKQRTTAKDVDARLASINTRLANLSERIKGALADA